MTEDLFVFIDSLTEEQTRIMNAILPPSIPDDDLIAKCSPRGSGNGGSVVWTSCYANYCSQATGLGIEPKPDSTKHPAMAYLMEHWTSTKRSYRVIDGIVVTNLYCGVGKGWDIIVEGTIMQHEGRKTDAQREAEKLLKGKC
ncbi:MAG TPA: hypothetical protein VNS88_09745 [Nitrospiraceae bacterium]|nr:hypothetical protein [Nitrospiraceae bacterium]